MPGASQDRKSFEQTLTACQLVLHIPVPVVKPARVRGALEDDLVSPVQPTRNGAAMAGVELVGSHERSHHLFARPALLQMADPACHFRSVRAAPQITLVIARENNTFVLQADGDSISDVEPAGARGAHVQP